MADAAATVPMPEMTSTEELSSAKNVSYGQTWLSLRRESAEIRGFASADSAQTIKNIEILCYMKTGFFLMTPEDFMLIRFFGACLQAHCDDEGNRRADSDTCCGAGLHMETICQNDKDQ